MNVFKLIQTLETLASTASTTFEYMTLSKAIQLLKLGRIQTVATIAALPTNLTTNGNLYYVTSEEDLYYNLGSTWYTIYVFTRPAYGWGNSYGGSLGDGTTLARSSPVTVVGGITTWNQISTGSYHTLAITSAGLAYGWGLNSSGQLGDNTITSRLSPVSIVGGITNWKQVEAGDQHSLGITESGIAYGWGRGNNGRLGDNTTSNRSSPVTVVGGITNWSQLSAGRLHSLALTSAGIAYGWGYSSAGALGDNTTTARSSPVTVVGGITTWSSVSAWDHTLATTTGGLAYAWGLNSSGRLGDNTTSNRSSPVTVVGGITTWSSVSAWDHTLATTTGGLAYAWGLNNYGRLGDGTATARSSPVTVVGGITNWSQVSAGGRFSLGITSAGLAYAWGYNAQGQLGTGNTSSRLSPVTVVGGFTNWYQVSSGGLHSIGLTSRLF